MTLPRDLQPHAPTAVQVSVILPARDCAGVVGAQLAALARQRYRGPWELILVDNGSGDHTRDVFEQWAALRPHARVVTARERRGAGYARNVGSTVATGELLLYCDADDVVGDDWVGAMARAADRGPLLAGSDVDTVEELRPDGVRGERRSVSARLPYARGGNLGIHASVLAQVGGWDEAWLRGQDVELSWRVQAHGHPLVRVVDARVWYRRHDGLWPLLRHQHAFGRQAPALYLRFADHGAPPWRPRHALVDVVRGLLRAPALLGPRQRRRRWLLGVAGSLGRLRGAVALARVSTGEAEPSARLPRHVVEHRPGPASTGVRGVAPPRSSPEARG